jgi:hypothetical protein
VDPSYESEHAARLLDAKRNSWTADDGTGSTQAERDLIAILQAAGRELKTRELVASAAARLTLPAPRLTSTVNTVLKKAVAKGLIEKPANGTYTLP